MIEQLSENVWKYRVMRGDLEVNHGFRTTANAAREAMLSDLKLSYMFNVKGN